MNCQEVMELMQRSLDGDLNAAETSLMTDHIRSCPDCAAMFERLTRLSNGLAQLPRVVPSFSIVDSILPQLEQIEVVTGDPSAPTADRAEAPSSSGAPLAPRSSRRRSRTLQRVSGVVAAGVVAGLLLFAHPLSWLHSSGVDYDAASQSDALTGSGASADSSQSPKNELFFAPMQKSAEGDESAQAKQAPSDSSSTGHDGAVPAGPNAEDKARAGGSSSLEGSAPAGNAPAPQPDSAAADGKEADRVSVQKELVDPPKTDNPSDAGAGDSSTGGAATSGSAGASGSDREGSASSSAVEGFAPSSIWQSPDGKLQATVNGGKLDIVRTDDSSVAFETAVPEGGAIDIMRWEEDSTALHYVRTEADGTKKALLWTAGTGQETEDTGK